MKRFIPNLICLLLFAVAGINFSSAQTKKLSKTPAQVHRCATEEAIALRYRTDPQFRALMDQRERDYQNWLTNRNANGDDPITPNQTSTLSAPVIIPVVVHIVLPNPNIIQEADVEYFINRLNLDFSGCNPDSTNGAPFYGVRSRCNEGMIRFCLARRDPAGNFTNGIQRRTGAGTIGGGEPQAIKGAANGLTPWDVTRYYNIWVGVGGGLLGIAPEIGPGTATSDGVCVDWQAFTNNACYTPPPFNLGRTAVHEIGHNFGLWHTFQGGCNNQDMQQLTTASCVLPGSILSLPDDTPAQSNPTSGCPSGAAASGCAGSPTPPGRMYQNYMDYTDDACYSMFTRTQMRRMEWVLENCRAGYLTSNGCQLPAGTPAVDAAAIEVVSPGGAELVGCTYTVYSVTGCSGNFTPKVRIQNRGSSTINGNVNIEFILNGTTYNQTVAVNIAYGKSQVVSLTPRVLNTGANTFSFRVIAAGDGNAANDLVNGNATFTPPASIPMPFAQDFTGTTFIPTNMVLVNPNNNNTWVRRTTGHLTTPGSAMIDFYNFNNQGQIDEMRTGLLSLGTPTDSIIISFSLAHKNFPGFNDRLQVLVSSDCGSTFTAGTNPVFDRSGATLATAGSSTAAYTTPVAADWRRFRLAVYTGPGSPYATGGNIVVSFHATNRYGNNIHIDDINVEKKVGRDMLVSLINTPGAQECNPSFMPSVVVRNNGAETITSYRVGYILDNGSTVFTATNPIVTPLAPGATTVINTFATPANAGPGNHAFRAFTADPVSSSGSGDQSPANDTASRNFQTRTLFASASEDFEGPAFPKPEWVLANPDNNFTWLRAAPGRAGSARRMFIDNFNNNNPGQTDDLRSAPVYCLNADSVRYSFDVAHRPFPGFSDRLQVLRSSDCGNTFVATGYDKNGTQLATGPAANGAYTSVADNEWRRESVTVSGAALAPGSMIFALRNVNGFGNHIHAENINVEVFYKRNLGILEIVRPLNECTQNVGPSVRVTNAGTETLTAFSIGYIIDANPPQIANFTGQSLAPGQSAVVSLPVSNGIALGAHSIVVYNVAPNVTSLTGSGDPFPLNDSLRTPFNVLGTQAAPLVEGFEGVVPPAKWAISNPDLNVTWSKQNTGNNSSGSASVQNFNYGNALTTSRADQLITPVVTYSNVDSAYLSFDVAAATRRYPGSTQIALDTLEVMVTKDCGNTFTTVWKKWGEDLQTINDPNNSNLLAFNPSRFDWKTVKMNITGVAGTSANNLYVIFRNGSNNDNNVYVDNVNISTLTLPARLKTQGYLLYPSPFTGAFNVQHFLPPTDLRYIDVYNARGQLVFKKQFGTGGANSTERIDLSALASGVYTVKLGYTNKQVVERIVKTNN